VAFALVLFFDLQTALPFADEWLYRWPIERFISGHGLQLWPEVQPASLVQIGASLLPAVAGLPPITWRLMALPFLALLAVFSWRIAKRLGASPMFAVLAGVVIICAPLTLQVSTGLMSDTAYLALMLGAALFTLQWMQDGKNRYYAVAFAALASLQRQHAIGIPLAMSLGVLMARRPLSRRDGVALGGAWTLVLFGIFLPFVTHLATPGMSQTFSPRALPHLLPNLVGTLLTVPAMLGLLMLPFAGILLPRADAERSSASRAEMVPVAIGIAGFVGGLVFALHFGTMIFPGDVFGNWGLGELHLGGSKPNLFPLPVFYGIEMAVTASFLVLLVWRRRIWSSLAATGGGAMLIALSLTQAIPMLFTSPTDRYHLAIAAPLAPVLAMVASNVRTSPALRAAGLGWALIALIAGLGYFVAGEQDYQAWQRARDETARQAIAAAGTQADVGFEAAGVYLAEPAVAATGRLPSYLDPNSLTVHDAKLRLEFSDQSDKRPGANYNSLSSGRIVIVPTGK
jgi:hypothetical protein